MALQEGLLLTIKLYPINCLGAFNRMEGLVYTYKLVDIAMSVRGLKKKHTHAQHSYANLTPSVDTAMFTEEYFY